MRLSAAEVWSRSGWSKEVQGPDLARLADRLSEANRYILYMYLLASQMEASKQLTTRHHQHPIYVHLPQACTQEA
jgi:hypothetical protein